MTCAAPRPLRPVRRHRGRARRRARQGEGVPGARRPGRHHRQEDRRPRHARDHVDLRRVPAPDDGGDPVLGLQGERDADAARSARSSRRAGSSSTPAGTPPTRGTRSVELAQLAEQLGYDHLWVYDHVETVPRREPTHCFEAFTTLAALAQVTTHDRARPARHVLELPQRRAARQGSRVHRRVLRRSAHPRARRGLVRARVRRRTATTYPPRRRRGSQVLDETHRRSSRGSGPRRRSRSQGEHLHFDGAYCDPKPIQRASPADLGRRRRREGHAAHRGAARRRDQLAGRPGPVRAQVEGAARSTASGSVATSTPSSAPTGPTAGCSTPKPTSTPGSTRPAAGQLWGRDAARGLRARQLRRHASSRSPRRCRASSTPAAREFVLWFRDYPSSESLERFAARGRARRSEA